MGHGDLHSVPTPSLASPTPPLQGPGGGGGTAICHIWAI